MRSAEAFDFSECRGPTAPGIQRDRKDVGMNFPEDLRNQIKTYIAERCGLYFRDHDLRNLEAGVVQRMKILGFDSVHAYYIHLTTSDEKELEFRELLNLLTINHTYFFRNEPQFLALKEAVLPALIEQKMKKVFNRKEIFKKTLRVWSAGCSTGEEPYTIAMILRESIPNIEDWDIEILATDASSDALGKARRGIYGENSMRLVEEPYRTKYFTRNLSGKQTKEWQISDDIKRMVKFGFLNLVADPYPPEIDILFCRNVTIYFEIQTTLRIMDNFFASLTEEGGLFLGYSESLQFLTNKFRMKSWQDGIYYRKATGKDAEIPAILSWQPREQESEEYEFAEELPIPALKAITETSQPVVLSPEEFENIRAQILRQIYLKEYTQALALIEKVSIEGGQMADIHYLAADIYANMNRNDEAKARLKKVFAIDALYAPAYYLLGCIYQEENKNSAAKENLQKALYIDKDLIMARFYMAHMFRSEGRVGDAIREYRNTLAALSKGLSGIRSEMTLQGSGFNTATLKSICCDNLERLKMEQA